MAKFLVIVKELCLVSPFGERNQDMTHIIRTSKDLGAALRKARRAAGLTQMQVADALGFSHQWISEIEAGKPNARIGPVLDVAAALNLTLLTGPVE